MQKSIHGNLSPARPIYLNNNRACQRSQIFDVYFNDRLILIQILVFMMTGTPAAFKTYRVQAYVVGLITDFLIDGRRIGLFRGAGTWDPNYTPWVDFLDHDVL